MDSWAWRAARPDFSGPRTPPGDRHGNFPGKCGMDIGIIGLGRMGGNIVRRLLRGGHRCVVFNRSPEPVRRVVEEGAVGAADYADLVRQLPKPRAVWIMLPAGAVTEQAVDTLAGLLEPGDIL